MTVALVWRRTLLYPPPIQQLFEQNLFTAIDGADDESTRKEAGVDVSTPLHNIAGSQRHIATNQQRTVLVSRRTLLYIPVYIRKLTAKNCIVERSRCWRELANFVIRLQSLSWILKFRIGTINCFLGRSRFGCRRVVTELHIGLVFGYPAQRVHALRALHSFPLAVRDRAAARFLSEAVCPCLARAPVTADLRA